jgi:hypothetical protein
MVEQFDAKLPTGPIEDAWDNHRFNLRLVNPANKRRFDIIVCLAELRPFLLRGPQDDPRELLRPSTTWPLASTTQKR